MIAKWVWDDSSIEYRRNGLNRQIQTSEEKDSEIDEFMQSIKCNHSIKYDEQSESTLFEVPLRPDMRQYSLCKHGRHFNGSGYFET